MKRKILHAMVLLLGLCLLGNNSSECGKKDSAAGIEKSTSTGQTRQTEWLNEEYLLIHDLLFQTI